MSDEIKEILYKLDAISNGAYNNDGYLELYSNEAKLLLDYITNLQQENEELKELSYMQHEEYNKLFNHLIIDRPRERIEKAIEYIKEHQRKDEFLNLNEWQARDLLNILQNGSDSQ